MSTTQLVFALCGLCALLSAARPAHAATETTSYPVIALPSECNATCESLPATLTANCTQCLYNNGAVNAWSGLFTGALCNGQEPAFTWACMSLLRSAALWNSSLSNRSALLRSPPLQRLPLYELGYTATPGIPLLQPTRFTDPILHPDTVRFVELRLADNFQFGPTGVKVCYPTGTNGTKCDTRPSGSDLGSLQVGGIDLTLGCIKTQGWLSPNGAATKKCPLHLEPLTATNVALNTPQQLAMMLPSTRGRQAWLATAQRQAYSYFTNVTAAQDSLWDVYHNLYASTLYLKNVSTIARLEALMALYGASWEPAWGELAAAGKLVELDLTYMAAFRPNLAERSAGDGPASVNLAAHALLVYRRGSSATADVSLRTIAVALGNFPNGTDAPFPTGERPCGSGGGASRLTVYKPSLSKSAFMFAMAAMRSAYMQQVIWAGHVYNFHILQGAVSYSLYNTIDAGIPVGLSSHPVRQLLDPYLDPSYLLEFNAALLGSLVPPPPTPVTPVDSSALPQFFELYAKAGPLGNATLHSCHPAQQLAASGLDARLFTSPNSCPASTAPWDQYPLAGVLLQILAVCTEGATAALSQYYISDAAVADDAAVQAWVAAMLAPDGGNLRQINAANAVQTRQQLYDLAGYLLYTSIAHGTSHLQDYTIRALSMAHLPPLLNTSRLPDPRATYSVDQMVAAVTNTDTYGKQANFVFAFIGSVPWTQFVPGPLNLTTGAGAPRYPDDLPFAGVGRDDGRSVMANAAIITMRQGVSKLLSDTRQSPLVRMTATNWGSPLVLPRVIDI